MNDVQKTERLAPPPEQREELAAGATKRKPGLMGRASGYPSGPEPVVNVAGVKKP